MYDMKNDATDNQCIVPCVGEPETAYMQCKTAQASYTFMSKADRNGRCITLEESERRVTNLIHKHFHPGE